MQVNFNESASEPVVCYLLKLTDSSLATFEKLNKSTSFTVKIKDANSGCLSFGTGSKVPDIDFSVATTSEKEKEKGKFSALSRTRGGGLKAIGDVLGRCTIAATDDTFDQTQKKQKQLDDLQKQSKVLPSGGVKRKSGMASASSSASALSKKPPKSSSSSASHSKSSHSNLGSGGGGRLTPTPTTNIKESILHRLALQAISKSDLEAKHGHSIETSMLNELATKDKNGLLVLKEHLMSKVKSDWHEYSREQSNAIITKKAKISFKKSTPVTAGTSAKQRPQVAEAPVKPAPTVTKSEPKFNKISKHSIVKSETVTKEERKSAPSSSSTLLSSSAANSSGSTMPELKHITEVRDRDHAEQLITMFNYHAGIYHDLRSKVEDRVSVFMEAKAKIDDYEKSGDVASVEALKRTLTAEARQLDKDLDYQTNKKRYGDMYKKLASIKMAVSRFEKQQQQSAS